MKPHGSNTANQRTWTRVHWLLLVGLWLTSCGQPESSTQRSAAVTVDSPSPVRSARATPTNTREPEPTEEPGFSATKVVEIEQEDHAFATVQAGGDFPTPAGTPDPEILVQATALAEGRYLTVEPTEAPTAGRYECDADHTLNINDCWIAQNGNQYTYIQTGLYPDNNAQSVLRVFTETGALMQDYPTPTPVDELYVESVVWPRVKLTSSLDQQPATVFIFNLATRAWEPPSVYQTPTPTPFGIPSGPLHIIGHPEDDNMIVDLPGRFSLTFDAAHTWQPTIWNDQGSDDTVNLARSDGPSRNDNVVQAPLQLFYDEWYTLANTKDATLTIQEENDTRVILQTAWYWDAPDGSAFTATATHTISATGEWQVEATLTNTNETVRTLGTIEYAFTNVQAQLGWSEVLARDGNSFTETRNAGAPRRSQLHVSRTNPIGTFGSDDTDNRYWGANSIILQPNETWRTVWVNQLWPGQP